jgi:AcrR family transcriptional regulator
MSVRTPDRKGAGRPANSRARQKEATRNALLDAGRTVFVRDGYRNGSLDRVAAEAGFTKGAVYANFATKADLLLAIYEERSVARAKAVAEASADVSDLDELRRRMVDDWRGVVEHERGWSLLLIEFWVHAAREPELRKRLRAAHLHVREAITAALTGVAERGEARLAMPPDRLATAVMALGNGLNLEAFLGEPQTDELYDTGTRLLGDGFLKS